MLRILRNATLLFITFWIGVGVCELRYHQVSLEVISADIPWFDGKRVIVESYVWMDHGSWYVGEPFDKFEALSILDISAVETDMTQLGTGFTSPRADNSYDRAKASVTGRIRDNCRGGITCCFGRTITIELESISQLAPAEYYTRPILPD